MAIKNIFLLIVLVSNMLFTACGQPVPPNPTDTTSEPIPSNTSLGEIQAVYYISPEGSDDNNGSFSNPFKTLQRARDEIRTINGNKSGDIIVYLLPGIYDLTYLFELAEQDSGTNSYNIIYQAYYDKNAIVSGGLRIPPTDWLLYDSANNIYRAYIGSRETRQLYVNGERAIRVRGPKDPDGFRDFVRKPYGYTDHATFFL